MKINQYQLCVAVAVLALDGVASFSNPSPKRYAHAGILKNNDLFSSKSIATAPRDTPSTKGESTALGAVPTWAYYSIGHIIGGNISVPFAIPATKSWYRRIPLPSWTPPSFVFAPVWTVLYGLMGISVSRIVKSGAPAANLATKIWALHYALNMLWPMIFFGLKRLRLGLIINISLVSSLGLIIPIFYRIDPLSACLQIPYFLWLLFATKLNETICKLNPTLGGVNGAKIEADLCASGEDGYNDAKLQYEIKKLQAAAKKYAGL